MQMEAVQACRGKTEASIYIQLSEKAILQS